MALGSYAVFALIAWWLVDRGGAMRSEAGREPTERCCAVVELRQYTFKPGRREDLIDIFDGHLIEGQESLGMTVIGQFRDQRRPDRFVWLRGFPDMEARRKALEAFYDGPIWAAHKDAANDTMLEWDDVLLLKPARPETAFDAGSDAEKAGPSSVVAGIYGLPRPIDAELVSRFEREVAPVLEARVRIEGIFVTEPPPTRSRDCPFAKASTCSCGSERWRVRVSRMARLDRRPDSRGPAGVLLYLEPTSRSKLGHGPDRPAPRSTTSISCSDPEGPQPLSRGPPAKVEGVDRVRVPLRSAAAPSRTREHGSLQLT